MFKKKPKLKVHSPYDNMQYNIGGVTYVNMKPVYIVNSAVTIQTSFIPIHNGLVMTKEGYCTAVIGGLTRVAKEDERCNQDCDCIKMYDRIVQYLQDTKCRCGHHYDYYNEGKTKLKYFCPATTHLPFYFDESKIYQLDPLDDFIREAVENAVRSTTPTVSSSPSIGASGMSVKEVLQTFLSDLSSKALIIPHLPDASSLPILLEWCRRRLYGDLTDRAEKRDLLASFRKWDEIEKINFRALAYIIPFTEKELHSMTWAHRYLIQKLFKILLDDFVLRNRIKQLELARIMFPTMFYEKHQNRAFLECFYTYMPGRLWDTYFINPYSSSQTKSDGAKTCPL